MAFDNVSDLVSNVLSNSPTFGNPSPAILAPTGQPVGVPAAGPAPVAPNIQTDPSVNPPAPLATRIFSGANDAAASRAASGAPPGRNQWAKDLIAGVSSAVTGLSNSLGDAAHAGDTKGGPLTGAVNTLAARNARIATTKQQGFENNLKTQEAAQRQKESDVNIAHAQANTLLAQQTLRHGDSDAKRDAFKSDQAVAADLDGVNTPKLATGLSSDSLSDWYNKNKGTKDKPGDAQSATVVVSSLQPTYDKDGNEFLRPLYTVYGAIPDVPLSQETADLLNKYHPSDATTLQKGTVIPGAAYIASVKQAKAAQAADLVTQKVIAETHKNQAEGDKAAEDVLDKKTRSQYGIDISAGLHQFGNDPIKYLDALGKSKDPQAPEMARKVNGYYGPDVIAKLQEDGRKEANENLRHTADIKQKQSDSSQNAGRTSMLKDAEKFQDTSRELDAAKKNVAAATTGDELASSMVPLMTALGVSTFAGVKRVNQTEIDSAGPGVGSQYRHLNNILDKAGKGTLSPDSLKEANDIFNRLSSTAYDHYVSQQLLTAAQRKMGDDELLYAPNGRDLISLGDAKKARGISDASPTSAPKVPPTGATNNVYAADGKTIIGHVVNNQYVPLGSK